MEIFNVGGPELILLLFLAGVLLGPRRMVLLAREIGEFLNQIKLLSRNLTKELNREIDLLDREMRITQPARLEEKANSNSAETTASSSQPDTAGSAEVSDTAVGDQPSNGQAFPQPTNAEENNDLPEAYKRFIEDFPGEGLENESPEMKGLEEEGLEIQTSSSVAATRTD
jgi:sec-independent protein translocase protein TatB